MWQAELNHATRLAEELEVGSELSAIWLSRAREAEKNLKDLQKRWLKRKARTDKKIADTEDLDNQIINLVDTILEEKGRSAYLLKRAKDAEAAKGAQGVEPAATYYKNRADKLADEVTELRGRTR